MAAGTQAQPVSRHTSTAVGQRPGLPLRPQPSLQPAQQPSSSNRVQTKWLKQGASTSPCRRTSPALDPQPCHLPAQQPGSAAPLPPPVCRPGAQTPPCAPPPLQDRRTGQQPQHIEEQQQQQRLVAPGVPPPLQGVGSGIPVSAASTQDPASTTSGSFGRMLLMRLNQQQAHLCKSTRLQAPPASALLCS